MANDLEGYPAKVAATKSLFTGSLFVPSAVLGTPNSRDHNFRINIAICAAHIMTCCRNEFRRKGWFGLPFSCVERPPIFLQPPRILCCSPFRFLRFDVGVLRLPAPHFRRLVSRCFNFDELFNSHSGKGQPCIFKTLIQFLVEFNGLAMGIVRVKVAVVADVEMGIC